MGRRDRKLYDTCDLCCSEFVEVKSFWQHARECERVICICWLIILSDAQLYNSGQVYKTGTIIAMYSAALIALGGFAIVDVFWGKYRKFET